MQLKGSCNPYLDLALLSGVLKPLTENGIFTYKRCRHSYVHIEEIGIAFW